MMNQLKTLLLLGTLSALLVGFGGWLGAGYLYLFAGLALVLNVGAYFFSDRLVLAMHQAQPLSRAEAPTLHRMVEELAGRAQIPMPRLFLIPAPYANAFATGRNPEHGVVAVTEGILRLLGERELRGVIAHEIAHIKNRDILISTVAATIASAITYIANAVQFSALFGGASQDEEEGNSPMGNFALAMVAPIAATLIQLAISRSREYVADETAARISGDPLSLASALETLHQSAEMMPVAVAPATASLFIVNPFAGRGGLLRLFSTHPPAEERIARLEAMSRDLGHRHRRTLVAA